jgi:hypothetical protein
VTDHAPVSVRDDATKRRRWQCPACDWATPWRLYTDPHDGPNAVRHAADSQDGGAMPQGA